MNTKAFTLVELAIVMTIIGLLIGGILKGQELLENARVTSTIAQIKSFQAAVNTFQDVYDLAVPGDMRNALSRIPNCTVASACANGNGNNEIGIKDVFHGNADATLAGESTQFWKHLALANLISGVNATATTIGFGSTHPAAKTGGGFFAKSVVTDMTDGDPGNWMKGNVLIIRSNENGAAGLWENISPLRAGQIDRKMDDGIAVTGTVRAVSNAWTSGCGNYTQPSNGPTGYNETITRKVCEIAIELGS